MLAAVPAPEEEADWDRDYERRVFGWAADRVRPEFRRDMAGVPALTGERQTIVKSRGRIGDRFGCGSRRPQPRRGPAEVLSCHELVGTDEGEEYPEVTEIACPPDSELRPVPRGSAPGRRCSDPVKPIRSQTSRQASLRVPASNGWPTDAG